MSINEPHMLRHTKIIATLGPSTDDPNDLDSVLKAGVNVVRLNFSHSSHELQKQRIDAVRAWSEKNDRIIGVLADLQGPKIRVANFKNGLVELEEGQAFILDADLDDDSGDETQVGIDYKDLPNDVNVKDILLLDDGRIVFEVTDVVDNKIHCTVITGGKLSNHKGINRKGGGLSADALTEKDKEDMEFVVKQNVDYIAISFPRHAEDMRYARELMEGFGGDAGLVAKIERAEAVEDIDEIILASDAVMVARGDLAVEVGDAQVPVIQKHIIQRARTLDRPVITATQMMESMIENSVPTRAEVSDVANAVLDYTDAVMLSAESAVGKHPAVVVESMSRACLAAEQHPESRVSGHRVELMFNRVDEAIAMATMYTANHLDIQAIVALTESSRTPLWMSRIRSAIPIYGLSRNPRSLGKMTMYRGVFPLYFDVTQCTREQINSVSVNTVLQRRSLNEGDRVILTKGDSIGVGGGSNAMKILTVGHIA